MVLSLQLERPDQFGAKITSAVLWGSRFFARWGQLLTALMIGGGWRRHLG